MIITSENLNDILILLSLVILVDGKVYPEEVEVMGSQLNKLVSSLDKNILFTPEMGKDWFTNNRRSLANQISDKLGNKAIDIAILKLKKLNPTVQQKLVYAMIRIGWSDAEYHKLEEDMVSRAIRIWNLKGSAMNRYSPE